METARLPRRRNALLEKWIFSPAVPSLRQNNQEHVWAQNAAQPLVIAHSLRNGKKNRAPRDTKTDFSRIGARFSGGRKFIVS